MTTALVLAAMYVSAVLAATLARWRAMKRAHINLTSGNYRNAINLLWAWATIEELRAVHFRWGEANFQGMLLQPDPGPSRIYHPHVLPVILGILAYQALRPGAWHGPGECPATPNCSNFLIGCLRRYYLLAALSKGYLRYHNCSGFTGISYHESML